MKYSKSNRIRIGLLCKQPERVERFLKKNNFVSTVIVDNYSLDGNSRIDAIFVDELPEESGPNNLGNIPIIFLAKETSQAYQALKIGVVDMILAPYKQESFDDAILKIMNYLKGQFLEKLDQMKGSVAYPRIDGIYLQFRSIKNCIVTLDFRKITFCKADGNLTYIFVSGKRKGIGDFPISHLAKVLLDYGFVQIHRKYIVNPDFIEDLINSGQARRYVKLIGHEEILPIARRKWKDFKQIFEKRDHL